MQLINIISTYFFCPLPPISYYLSFFSFLLPLSSNPFSHSSFSLCTLFFHYSFILLLLYFLIPCLFPFLYETNLYWIMAQLYIFFSICGAIFELFGSSFLLVEYVREMCIFWGKERLRASEVHHVNVCGSKSWFGSLMHFYSRLQSLCLLMVRINREKNVDSKVTMSIKV